ncbi:hypothetical protein PF008_g19398 [Phytophthora fragariae]|uniref:Uncharacterized protein n=1 Tax=Phytophthora fragariae TaxID=53985 RepID=A0A6G0R2I6_9STRA|nr:hypothetical protein PF008_g19398 [Phytophthora fragariae]
MSLQTVDLRINWLRPVSARGPTPVQLLLDWYQENEDSYLQSTDQRKELRRLCKLLNGLGVKCDLDDILADFQQLQSVLLDQSMLQKAAFKNLLPFRERLLHLVLITKQEPEQEPQPATGEAQLNSSNLGDRSTYFGWHKPSPSGGPCAMEIMVTWLQANYGKLSRANKTKRKKLLDEIVREIQVSGHSGCTESKVHSQISHLRLKVKRGKKFSGSFLPYYTRLRDIFSEGRKTSTRENVEQKGDSSLVKSLIWYKCMRMETMDSTVLAWMHLQLEALTLTCLTTCRVNCRKLLRLSRSNTLEHDALQLSWIRTMITNVNTNRLRKCTVIAHTSRLQ